MVQLLINVHLWCLKWKTLERQKNHLNLVLVCRLLIDWHHAFDAEHVCRHWDERRVGTFDFNFECGVGDEDIDDLLLDVFLVGILTVTGVLEDLLHLLLMQWAILLEHFVLG